MSNTRLISIIVLTAALTAAFMSGGAVVQNAHADTPRTAACTWALEDGEGKTKMDRGNDGVRAWMDSQLAQGRTQFTSVVRPTGLTSLCAW